MAQTNEGEYVSVDASSFLPSPSAPWDLVVSRFDNTLAMANTMTDLLIGPTGTTGYLGVLAELLDETAPTASISADSVDTALVISSVKTPPSFNKDSIESFPDFTFSDPQLETIPLVDVSTLKPPTTPTDINPSITWTELPLNQDIYQQLLTRIAEDLVYGATGLTTEVQDAIFSAGQDRQRRENDKAYQKIQNDIAGRGSTLPTGALLSAISEISAEILEQNSNLNRTIVVEQAELAQKNSQFIIEQARQLETLLRETRNNDSNRSLDYEKAVASLVIQVYVEKVKMYIAIAEANKIYVEAQVANLKAITAYNMALIDEYKAFIETYGARINAVSSKNTSLIDVYRAEIAGYDTEVTALTKVDLVKLEKIKLDIEEADLNLRAAIAETESTLAGYSTEASLKEKISNDMAGIANQTLVGALSSVNANASLGYSGSESQSESWGHSDSLSESHSYPHDPEA